MLCYGRLHDEKVQLDFEPMLRVYQIEKRTFADSRQLFESNAITLEKNRLNTSVIC
jgi:hypothetical protein